jgi:hypothetical protein
MKMDEVEETKWREWMETWSGGWSETAMREWIQTASRDAEHDFNATGEIEHTCCVFTATGMQILPPPPNGATVSPKVFFKRLRKMKAIGYVVTGEAWMITKTPVEMQEQFDRFSTPGAIRSDPNAVDVVTFNACNHVGETLMAYRDIIRRPGAPARLGPLIVTSTWGALNETCSIAVQGGATH